MKYNILIVGAGQLGSRYLQGLAKYPEPLSIYVIDINQDSLDTAASRWLEVASDLHSVSFYKNFDQLPANIDLAIVSTSSNVRENVVSSLKKISIVRNWILEKVLAQNVEGIDHLETMIGENVWVNTYFRTLEWFKEIKRISASGHVHVEVTGGNWGIACNTIHFIDFISWWTGEKIAGFDHSMLNKDWHPAKRNGFWEINGRLGANFSAGSTATFTSDDSDAPFEIKIKTTGEEWLIQWDKGIAVRNDGFLLPGKVLFQSEMTAGLVEDILDKEGPELPALSVSAEQHRPFLESLLGHWNTNRSEKAASVPIT